MAKKHTEQKVGPVFFALEPTQIELILQCAAELFGNIDIFDEDFNEYYSEARELVIVVSKVAKLLEVKDSRAFFCVSIPNGQKEEETESEPS